MPTCAQADAVSRMGAEIVKNNQLLHRLAQQFPRTHANCSVSTFDFQAAWNQASFLALNKTTPNTSKELLKNFFVVYSDMCMYRLTSPSCGRAHYVGIAVPDQVNLLIGHDAPYLAAQAGSKRYLAGADE